MNWQIIVAFLLGLYFLKTQLKDQNNKKELVEEAKSNNSGFNVILPNTIDFKNAKVTLVSGFKNYTKLNVSGKIHFPLSQIAIIDKIKVRTTGGKEYNYAEQSNPGQLVVKPITCFECNFNGWRH